MDGRGQTRPSSCNQNVTMKAYHFLKFSGLIFNKLTETWRAVIQSSLFPVSDNLDVVNVSHAHNGTDV
jgi:hypothetical protein